MRARLYIPASDMDAPLAVPPMPPALIEDGGYVVAYVGGWPRRVAQGTLDELTEQSAAEALNMPAGVHVHLSAVRDLATDDLTSPEAIQALQDWWLAFANDVAADPSRSTARRRRVA